MQKMSQSNKIIEICPSKRKYRSSSLYKHSFYNCVKIIESRVKST